MKIRRLNESFIDNGYYAIEKYDKAVADYDRGIGDVGGIINAANNVCEELEHCLKSLERYEYYEGLDRKSNFPLKEGKGSDIEQRHISLGELKRIFKGYKFV